jgi:pimeloyl-ACP methyl ester carboxylesterase
MHIEHHGKGSSRYAAFHGWSGDHRTFDSLVPFLPLDSTFSCFDLPGCGKSPDPENWKMNALIAALLDSVASLGNGPSTFIGSCSGAILGLLVAKARPELFRRLVLVDPFAYMPWYFSVFLNKHFGRQAYMTTFANPVGRWITNTSLRKRRTGNTDLTKSFEEVNHASVYEYLRMLGRTGKPEQFVELANPVDLLYGENTFTDVKKSIGIWKTIFPQARVFELKGAGHLPIEEASQQVAEILFEHKQQ